MPGNCEPCPGKRNAVFAVWFEDIRLHCSQHRRPASTYPSNNPIPAPHKIHAAPKTIRSGSVPYSPRNQVSAIPSQNVAAAVANAQFATSCDAYNRANLPIIQTAAHNNGTAASTFPRFPSHQKATLPTVQSSPPQTKRISPPRMPAPSAPLATYKPPGLKHVPVGTN